MQKRARILDGKLKRLHINRKCRTENSSKFSIAITYLRLITLWTLIVLTDGTTGLRFELLWPFWLLVRAGYESFRKNQHCVSSLATNQTARFSVLFVCVTATSDLICYLFIPVRLLIFMATTYVWIHLILHCHGGFIRSMNTFYCGDRLRSWNITLLTAFVIIFELFLRPRADSVLLSTRDQFLPSYFPSAVCLLSSLSSVLPRTINSFFGAHSIGYPVILITVSLHYYFNEWKMRRKQGDVTNKNEQLYRILVESIPAEYEGPKDYSNGGGQCLNEDDCYILDDRPQMAITAGGTQTPTVVHTPPTNTKKHNGYHKHRDQTTSKRGKKNGGVYNNSTPPNESKKKAKHHEMEEMDDSDGDDDSWRGDMDDHNTNPSDLESTPSNGMWLIRLITDVTSWTFSLIVGLLIPSFRKSRQVIESNEDDDFESVNGDFMQETKMTGRNDSISLNHTKSRSNTANSQQRNGGTNHNNNNNNNNKRANGKNKGGGGQQSQQQQQQHEKTNGNATANGRNGGATIRDSSHDTNASSSNNDAELRSLLREVETLRCELNTKRSSEDDMKLQLSMLESNETRLTSTISHMKMRVDQMENKCQTMEKHRESDKSSIEQSERKYAELMMRKSELEHALIIERKARNEDTGKKMDLSEHQREKERQLEREVDRLRVELKSKEDYGMKLENDVSMLRNYKEDNDIDTMKMENRMLREKCAHLETSLASENKLKQELFRALGDIKGKNKLMEKRLLDLEGAMKNNSRHVMDIADDTSNSTKSSPLQHEMVSPTPSNPSKVPLSINVNNTKHSPFHDKISPPQPPKMKNHVAPPDYHMAITQHKAVVAPPGFMQHHHYNQFQLPHSTTGEHVLFDAPQQSTPSVATCAALSNHDLLVNENIGMGRFGVPTNPAARSS